MKKNSKIKDSSAVLFKKYCWLFNVLIASKGVTIEEIKELWYRSEISSESELSTRSFHRYRQAVQELFDVIIECKKGKGATYFIEGADEIKCGMRQDWLMNAFAVNHLIEESVGIKERILFEKIPSGQLYLFPIIRAMKESLCLQVSYHSFWRSEPCTLFLEPYCVKLFKQRWYLLAYSSEFSELRLYSLDRMKQLELTETSFTIDPNFDAENYFLHSYGIIVDEEYPPEVVQLKVHGFQANFLKTLPLHASQEAEDRDGYTLFTFYVRPGQDFLKELLWHGSSVEVISPQWLRQEMAAEAKLLLERNN
ncbi:MAG: helix-turn-helix transcriptional regulator [Phocaeicola sp.]